MHAAMIAAAASSALRRLARGEALLPDGAPLCPPPCNTRTVNGVCPVCGKQIHLRLGQPRLKVLQPVEDYSKAGFSFDRPAPMGLGERSLQCV